MEKEEEDERVGGETMDDVIRTAKEASLVLNFNTVEDTRSPADKNKDKDTDKDYGRCDQDCQGGEFGIEDTRASAGLTFLAVTDSWSC